MFEDEHRYEVWELIRQQDLKAFARLLPQSLLIQAAKQAGVRITRSPLAIPNLVWLGLPAALHSTESFTKVLSLTVRVLDMSANRSTRTSARALSRPPTLGPAHCDIRSGTREERAILIMSEASRRRKSQSFQHLRHRPKTSIFLNSDRTGGRVATTQILFMSAESPPIPRSPPPPSPSSLPSGCPDSALTFPAPSL